MDDDSQAREYHPSVIEFCKIVLNMKAFSGGTGTAVEKNINEVYSLLTEDAAPPTPAVVAVEN